MTCRATPSTATARRSSPEALAAIRAAYEQEMVSFPWAEGDVLMLDNMLVAHGRRPYAGPRKVLVGMAEPWGVPVETDAMQRGRA